MIFISGSVNCTPPGFYRKPETIKEDIRRIKERITAVNDMLNVREMLAEYFDKSGMITAKDAVALNELLEFAKETLDEFIELNLALDELKKELVYSIGAIG